MLAVPHLHHQHTVHEVSVVWAPLTPVELATRLCRLCRAPLHLHLHMQPPKGQTHEESLPPHLYLLRQLQSHITDINN